MNAFLYLVTTSGRNRLRLLVRRVRTPRYVLALVVGGLYLWFFFLRPVDYAGGDPGFFNRPTEMVVTALALLTLVGTWTFGSDATALAFSPAEVALLFPAPITRRALIGYKLFRAQLVVLLNALIWVFLLRRGGSELPGLLRAVALWAWFSTISLHRLGAALVRSSWREHGAAGARRHRWSIAVFAIVGTAVVVSLVQHRHHLTVGPGLGAFFTSLGDALASAPASWVLFPLRLVVAPVFTHSALEWQRAIGPALLMVGAHAWWVLRADTAFEDAAIQASAERARRIQATRARRSGLATPPRRMSSTIALASAGRPAWAIIWKNMLCLRRTAQLRLFIGPLAMAVLIGTALPGSGSDLPSVIASSALTLAALMLVFGGRLIRNDLRQDMQHLPMLKTLPIAPGELMIAEVASSALPMAAVQLVLLIIAYVAAATTDFTLVGPDVRLGVLLAAPIAVLALNGALMSIQNSLAVLFPGWVRLGPAVSSGVEVLGQNLMATIANLFSLALALLPPLAAGFVVRRALGGIGVVPIAAAISAGSVVLAGETYLVLRFLGGAFAKAEPQV